MAAAAALAEVDQCLQWIGLTDVQHRNSIIAEGGFNGLNDFFNVTETDIRDMAKSFSKRSPAANRINFGMRRIKWLIAMMHWCQDHQRCSEEPDIADFANADAFKEALQVSDREHYSGRTIQTRLIRSVKRPTLENLRTRKNGPIGNQLSLIIYLPYPV